jgi:hypothetical protein
MSTSEMVKIEMLSSDALKSKGIFSWAIWEKEKSSFDWFYDTEEQCYFLEGEVEIITPEGNVSIKKGDFVTFKKGLSCTWNVLKKVRKHYKFSD